MLTGLELTCMGVTQSNSGPFSTLVFLSHLWEKEIGGVEKKKKEGKEGKRE